MKDWLGLMIGNSRLHWGLFRNNRLAKTWNTLQAESLAELNTVVEDEELKECLQAQIPLYFASVVPSATKMYLSLPQARIIDCSLIPLKNTYPSLGSDRILTLWGGGCKYGFPCLVVDSGTALTFSGADAQRRFQGGAILPGVRLQLQALFFHTASLPEVEVMADLTPRWATNTPCAIQSGVIYTIIAGIRDFAEDWLKRYPASRIIFTGGDALLLSHYFRHIYPHFPAELIVDPNLIFLGMWEYVSLLDCPC